MKIKYLSGNPLLGDLSYIEKNQLEKRTRKERSNDKIAYVSEQPDLDASAD